MAESWGQQLAPSAAGITGTAGTAAITRTTLLLAGVRGLGTTFTRG